MCGAPIIDPMAEERVAAKTPAMTSTGHRARSRTIMLFWSRVPRGMARAGSRRSPDMFAPAIIPVAAGKNRANMVKGLSPSLRSELRFCCRSAASKLEAAPRKKETRAATRTARIPYCTLMVQPAPMCTQVKTSRFVTLATHRVRSARDEKVAAQASVKPTIYMATETAWARKNTAPIEPPYSAPRVRLIM